MHDAERDREEFERIKRENEDRHQKSWDQWQNQGSPFVDPVST